MAVQLRLVDPTPPATPRSARRASTAATSTRTARTAPIRGRVKGSSKTVKGSARRSAQWGEWQLDTRTRTIGRAGVAAARAALEQAAEQDTLPRAS